MNRNRTENKNQKDNEINFNVKDNDKKPEVGNELIISYKTNTEGKSEGLTKGIIVDINNGGFTVKTEKEIPINKNIEYQLLENTASIDKPRSKINEYIKEEEIFNLILESAKLHGHLCPMLVLGVKVGVDGLSQLDTDHKGMEDVVVLVETNSCFTDGIQLTTGCTFGNNALIYRDYGKTAATIIQRGEKALRYHYEDYDYIEKNYPEAYELFETVVVEREGTQKEQKMLREKWMETALDLINKPLNEMFKIEKTSSTDHLDLPEKAPIFEDRFCIECGEKIMAEKAVETAENRYKCIPCSNGNYIQLDGSGLQNK
ncbi:FmdE family protein [Methanonatronarchaeum sp. AMET6-2]|uniref:FmdE family protein n=1 Tax=Methanonatronarchaeum sp. AMET6-2 TaxID=2933293 RepID=UPI001FF345A6|nr:FmdE family protein [Methanonatronarchaeum sp. AMET6-2]UOY10541.1 FmdE family protein [Methanonatronarchaeum sp. AMET6-2]